MKDLLSYYGPPARRLRYIVDHLVGRLIQAKQRSRKLSASIAQETPMTLTLIHDLVLRTWIGQLSKRACK